MNENTNESQYKIEGFLCDIWEGRGKILAVTHTRSQTVAAVKVFSIDKCLENLDVIQHEAHTLRSVRHPNICSLLASFTPLNKKEIWLVMPAFVCSAQQLIQDEYVYGLPELAIAIIARDILQALQYLHSRFIIHRAVQARHILLSEGGRAVLSGLKHSIDHPAAYIDPSATLHQYPPHPIPLLNWTSPEMLQQDLRGYSFPTDVYSLGLTVCELSNAEEPYEGLDATLMMVEKLKGLVPYIRDASRLGQESRSNSRASNTDDDDDGGLQLANDAASESNASNSTSSTKMLSQQKRQFSNSAHEFVRLTLALDPYKRPSVSSLLNNYGFIRQIKKLGNNVTLLSVLQVGQLRCTLTDPTVEIEEQLSEISVDDTSWVFDAS